MATIREAVSALVRELTNCADITCYGERSLVAEMTSFVENEIRAEREACARLCDELDNGENSADYASAARWCAARIRAR